MGLFATTRWSLVMRAGRKGAREDRALEELCVIYRPAVVSWFRQHGLDPDAADDLTQSFFAKLLEGNTIGVADPRRGRFRTFLGTALRNFHLHHLEREAARKRGGGVAHVSHEDLPLDDAGLTPEQALDRQFARIVISRAISRLEGETRQAGRGELFARLREFLIEQPDPEDYQRVAKELGMRRNTVAVAVHRLRSRLRTLAREELRDTVHDESALAEELRLLRGSLVGPSPANNAAVIGGGDSGIGSGRKVERRASRIEEGDDE